MALEIAKSVIGKLQEATDKNDMDAIGSLHTEDSVMIAPFTQPLKGFQAQKEHFEQKKKMMSGMKMTMTVKEAVDAGDYVVALLCTEMKHDKGEMKAGTMVLIDKKAKKLKWCCTSPHSKPDGS